MKGFKLFLFEGGNASAIDRKTGVKKAYAQKMDLNAVQRKTLTNEFKVVFSKINNEFNKKFKYPLWKDFKIVENGLAFNGSSAFLFDKSIPDDEFIKFKPKVGDIDITVPHEALKNLFDVLAKLEDKAITPKITYVGQGKQNIGDGHQINCVFKYDIDGKDVLMCQVDFEGVEYKKDKPTDWAKFSHNSDWKDIQQGFKGVAHKYLLTNLVRAISADDGIILMTSKTMKPKKLQPGELPRHLAFSVDRGLRVKLEPALDENGKKIIIDGKIAFKEIATADSDYEVNLKRIFQLIFKSTPDKKELELMYSFLGLLELAKKYMKKPQIEEMFNFLMNLSLYGPGAQGLERNDPEKDEEVKMAMVHKIIETFPFIKLDKFKKQIQDYYKNYRMTEISV